MAGEKYVWLLVLLLTILETVTTGIVWGWGWRVHADNEAIVINRLHKWY